MRLLTSNQVPLEYNKGLLARLFARIDTMFNLIAPTIAFTKTASFQLGEGERRVICNGSGSITVTLPNPARYSGPDLHIKTIAAFTVVSASANVIPLAGGAAGTAILPATAGSWAILQTNGTSWAIVEQGSTGTAPGGSTTQVQFNDAGAFGGDAGFVWDKTNNILTIGTTATEGYIGSPSAGSANTAGSALRIFTGDGDGSGAGGVLAITAGGGGDTGTGGAGSIGGGSGGDTSGNGGAAYTQGGNAGGSGHGGNAYLAGGAAVGAAKQGGHCLLQPGAASGGAVLGQIMCGSGSAIATNGTGGFFCLPSCAGVPTGVPANVQTGSIAMIYDSTNNRIYAYNGAWRMVLLA